MGFKSFFCLSVTALCLPTLFSAGLFTALIATVYLASETTPAYRKNQSAPFALNFFLEV